jgi:hypothetical protein
VPGDFLVRVGEGWSGPLHDLAGALATWERGPAAAAGVLLSWFEFVAFEVEGFEECRSLMEGMRVLKGAVMAAGVEAAGAGCAW